MPVSKRSSVDAITASANPRVIAILTALLNLRRSTPDAPACSLDGDVAIWRLERGIVVTCTFTGNHAHWHIDRDDLPTARQRRDYSHVR